MQNRKVLISGGSGLVGRHLTEMLQEKGHEVAWLTRNPKKNHKMKVFGWDISRQEMDEAALQWADAVVHLAGTGVADKRWTKKRKQDIIDSRVDSAALLVEKMRALNRPLPVISASGVNYYDMNTGDAWIAEEHAPGNDFLAEVTRKWEDAVQQAASGGSRVVRLRIGAVLTTKGGALPQLTLPVKWWAGAPLGSGNQYMSWIHIDDLCGVFIKALEDPEMEGAYNAVAPHPVTNREMTRAIARVLKKPLWLPNVPGFVLKIMLGEMADMVLKGSRISCKKLESRGFSFRYPELEQALRHLFA